MVSTISPDRSTAERTSPLTSMMLLAVAAVLLASQTYLARQAGLWTHASVRTVPDVLPVVGLLAIPALLALALVPRLIARPATPALLWSVLALGLAMRLVWYGAPAPLEDDFYRYMWDGAVVAAGQNPYALSPAEAASGQGLHAPLGTLAARAQDVLARVNFPDMTSIYPGFAQIAFALAHFISPFSLDALRFVFLLADVASLAVLLTIAKDLGRPPAIVALYWLNPLVVWSSHGTVHSDALLPPLLLGACLTAWRGRSVRSAVLLAAAVGVKIWPVLLAPLLARTLLTQGRRLWLPALAFGLVAAILLLPLGLSALSGMRSGLVAYSEGWSNNNAPLRWLSYAGYVVSGGDPMAQRLLRLAVTLAGALVALYLARHPPKSLRDLLVAAATLSAALFYLSPTEFPWYALWFLGFAAAIECRPLLLASATLATYYFFFPLAAQGKAYVHMYDVAFLHALPVWAWLAWDWRRLRDERLQSGSS